MNQPPSVSVLMPVFNGGQYLKEAVESILNQSFTQFELLIIDDGSIDDSLKILQQYAESDRRIRLWSRENRGLVQTLNELIEMARSPFLARMDADDVALPDRLLHQVQKLERQPNLLCVGGAYDMVDQQGEWLLHVSPALQNDEIQQRLLSGSSPIQHSCAMMRRSAVLQVGGYDPATFPAEDLDLWLRLGELGELANLQETILKYRVHTASITSKRLKQHSQTVRKVCEQAWQRRGLKNLPHCEKVEQRYQQLMLRCGWQAFLNRQREAAVSYGVRAVQALPLDLESWRLLVCAAIKPFPKGDLV
ncbi:MAG: glycosyltransferase [Leptolyngbyaceae cyanobacterium HOT.MB2.61]|jgi:glycosyltransferase involved in cell wall biosynthesis|nr:glycosyltransferase [Leptolyngbyaceae cyanobacterium HOT.MB2.61]